MPVESPSRCPGITVAIPVYNEEAILVPNVGRLLQFLEHLGTQYEVLLGSNGSTDRTRALGEQLARRHRAVEFFHLEQRGVGRAFREFIRRANYPVLISLDMDLSVDLDFIVQTLRRVDAHDIVVGSKKLANQRRSRFRKLGSDTFLWCVRRLMALPFDDYSIAAKAYRTRFLREHADEVDTGTSYVLNLCAAAVREGRAVARVPVHCEDWRTSRFNLLAEAWYKFRHLFELWFRTLCTSGAHMRAPQPAAARLDSHSG